MRREKTVSMSDIVYPPAEDSELLLECALKEVKENDEVLEVGVGSGYVSERLKSMCRFLLATDINPFACKFARDKGIEVIRTDLVKGIRKKFTLILFNPPYLELDEYERVGDWLEKAIDGGKHGIEVMCRFLDEVKEVLDEKIGRIIMIVSSFNIPKIFEEIERRGFEWEVVGRRYLFFEELYALRIRVKKV